MEEYVKPVKKPSGCLKIFGWLLTIGSVSFIVFCIAMIFEGEKHFIFSSTVITASEGTESV